MSRVVAAFFGVGCLFVGGSAFAQTCEPVQLCGDVDASGKVGTTDALRVLKTAVGQQQNLVCTCSAGDGSCEADLQSCNSDLAQCGDDLQACEGSPPEQIYEPIVVCGTDEPGDKFTLDEIEYVIVETDVRIASTQRRYALRMPVPFGTSYSVVHYVLQPLCGGSFETTTCPTFVGVLNVCGKVGIAGYSESGGSHLESSTNSYVNAERRWWYGGFLSVEEGYKRLVLPTPKLVAGDLLPTPTLAEQGWSLLNEEVGVLEGPSYEKLREFYSHFSIREL